MSIRPILETLLNAKALFKWESFDLQSLGLEPDETARDIYVSPSIMASVAPPFPFPDTEEGERLAEFCAWLDVFVEGGELSVSEDPDNKPPETMLARVHKIEDEFWSIRVTEPERTPGIRAFGAFVDTDEFVALTWTMREDIEIFNDEVAEAKAIWKDHFGSEIPHHGSTLNAYLTICSPV